MSYEGYSQFWCKQGHYWEEDCNLADKRNPCRICGSKVVVENMVDTTNDEGNPVKVERLHSVKCPQCNSVLEETFKIPKIK